MEEIEINKASLFFTLAIITVIILIVGALVGIFTASWSESEIAVLYDGWGGGHQVLGPGPRLIFKLPWQYIRVIPRSVLSLDMWSDAGKTGEWPGVKVLTADGLQAVVDITIQYRLNPQYAYEITYRYPNNEWEETTLAPVLREVLRNVIANYTAVETISKREEISILIDELFRENLPPEVKDYFIIVQVNLRNIELPTEYMKAIQDKLTAEQLKLKAIYDRERTLIEANATAMKKILEARGEAQAKIEAAKGEAQAKLIEADAEAKAIMMKANATRYQIVLIVTSFNDTELALRYLQTLYMSQALQNSTLYLTPEQMLMLFDAKGRP